MGWMNLGFLMIWLKHKTLLRERYHRTLQGVRFKPSRPLSLYISPCEVRCTERLFGDGFGAGAVDYDLTRDESGLLRLRRQTLLQFCLVRRFESRSLLLPTTLALGYCPNANFQEGIDPDVCLQLRLPFFALKRFPSLLDMPSSAEFGVLPCTTTNRYTENRSTILQYTVLVLDATVEIGRLDAEENT
mmetsp:Transcript_7376/g.10838  ORF Transcript_7376/g.10838 Transcript_7376/m.10838 type:complete len:188 (+) Transcript_7376:1861-2424(+)